MTHFRYYCGKKRVSVQFETLEKMMHRPGRAGAAGPRARGSAILSTLNAQHARRLSTRLHRIDESQVRIQTRAQPEVRLIATESLVLDGASQSEIRFARDKYGFEVVQEGRHGKVLLQSPGDADGVSAAFQAAEAIHRRGRVRAAHPNFLRVVHRPAPSHGTPISNQWNLDNPGDPGLIGADVHAPATWTVTRGDPDVRVAVLDEGVDSLHPHLQAVIAAEADFVDDNGHARPDGDDAHGTACAGIIASQSPTATGLAPEVSLVGVRIAKGDGLGNWIFDDFDTADAIDWSWDDAQADVLSNSWGGGPPVDVMTNAFARARTQGRGGLGSVIVIAAGNAQSQVDYPGNLDDVLTVGASNEWDQRKTTTSNDGEDWWGSNFGAALDLLAPGVHIRTTDIHGSRGYAGGMFTDTFNGTSSATPHAAAAAGLMLSVNPGLTEARVREIINATADPLTAAGWNPLTGHGRLNAYRAVRQARRG